MEINSKRSRRKKLGKWRRAKWQEDSDKMDVRRREVLVREGAGKDLSED